MRSSKGWLRKTFANLMCFYEQQEALQPMSASIDHLEARLRDHFGHEAWDKAVAQVEMERALREHHRDR